jgi:tyrosine-protein phosphatase non-receptor type 4
MCTFELLFVGEDGILFQVVLINGVEVSGMVHEQVVSLIRASRETRPGGELLLTVRPSSMYHLSTAVNSNSN